MSSEFVDALNGRSTRLIAQGRRSAPRATSAAPSGPATCEADTAAPGSTTRGAAVRPPPRRASASSRPARGGTGVGAAPRSELVSGPSVAAAVRSAGMRLLRLATDLPDAAGPTRSSSSRSTAGPTPAAPARPRPSSCSTQFETTELGAFDPDALFDYRDRRPVVEIDAGVLGDPRWPELHVDLVTPPSGPDARRRRPAPNRTCGGGPSATTSSSWRPTVGVAPVRRPRQRPRARSRTPGPCSSSRTSSDAELLARFGRPHEQVVVPASCQVALEADAARRRADDARAVGAPAPLRRDRLPRRVQGAARDGSRPSPVRRSTCPASTAAIDDQREQLDEAAAASEEITEHVRGLESMYDAVDRGRAARTARPTGDALGGCAPNRCRPVTRSPPRSSASSAAAPD